MTQFDRRAVLDIERTDGKAVRVEGLRIAFSVEKTRTETANRASIQVYNLADTTREQILEKNARVILRCGYAEGTGDEVLFIGNAEFISHARQFPSVITNIETQDGVRELREVRISVSFGAGATGSQVLRGVARQLGLPIRIFKEPSGTYPGGYAFAGPVGNALDQITRRFGLEWSVQNGELQIIEASGTTGEKAVVLTPDTGLIGSPERLQRTDGELDGETETDPEWRVRCLLQPIILPGGIIELESAEVEGRFSVDRVLHSGDTRGDAWESEVELRSLT